MTNDPNVTALLEEMSRLRARDAEELVAVTVDVTFERLRVARLVVARHFVC